MFSAKKSLTEDRLRALLYVVERLMEYQPLRYVSGNVTNLQLMTPNHFRIGLICFNWPNALFSGTTASYRKLIREQHFVLDFLWSPWMSEYLPSLQQRTKWSKEEHIEPKNGDLVWIFDKIVHPVNFPLERIEKVHKSDNQTFRPELVRTATSSYKRPIVMLIALNSDRKWCYLWIYDQKLAGYVAFKTQYFFKFSYQVIRLFYNEY